SRLERIEAGYARRILRGTGVLATIGATAPFVGLFGTVWGIMNSFIGISKSHTTNLAVVAPGIAEALLATALGLAAAIPPVVIYMVAAPLAPVDIALNLPAFTPEAQPRPERPLYLTLKSDLTLALGDIPSVASSCPERSMPPPKATRTRAFSCARTRRSRT